MMEGRGRHKKIGPDLSGPTLKLNLRMSYSYFFFFAAVFFFAAAFFLVAFFIE
jgi:hypothetical protein